MEDKLKPIISNSTNLLNVLVNICLEYCKIEKCVMCEVETKTQKLGDLDLCYLCYKYRIIAYATKK
jgi:hypothetical protein